jgi:hypothetical protein
MLPSAFGSGRSANLTPHENSGGVRRIRRPPIRLTLREDGKGGLCRYTGHRKTGGLPWYTAPPATIRAYVVALGGSAANPTGLIPASPQFVESSWEWDLRYRSGASSQRCFGGCSPKLERTGPVLRSDESPSGTARCDARGRLQFRLSEGYGRGGAASVVHI